MASITIYSTPTCPYCDMAKKFLKDKKIAFKSIDVSENRKAAEEMIKKSGQMGVPVIDVDGQIIIGFDREALKKALKLS